MLEFEWDEANTSHIALHSVTPQEAEEVLTKPTFEFDVYDVDGEERLEEIGSTNKGRILKVVTTVRDGLLRVITAYDASQSLKQAFLEHQRKLYD